MSHRRDAAGIGTVQLADEVEDAREALLIDGRLAFGERQARKVRDALDLLASQGHGNARKKREKRLKIIKLALCYVMSVARLRATSGGRTPASHVFPVASCSNACADISPAICRSTWGRPTRSSTFATRALSSTSPPSSRCRTSQAVAVR